MALCFKDRTFCIAMCRTHQCHRHWTDELQFQAEQWWSHDPDNAPIAFSDFSKTCESYHPVGVNNAD